MNPTEKPVQFIPSASEYILDNFESTDRIAMLVLNRDFGETVQRITSAQKAASPEFQAWLRYKNANGSDIYIGMNPLKKDASTRTKEGIESIRHVYLDLDHGGPEALETIENSSVVPKPNYVLNSSPEKHQVVWKVEGMHLEEAERARNMGTLVDQCKTYQRSNPAFPAWTLHSFSLGKYGASRVAEPPVGQCERAGSLRRKNDQIRSLSRWMFVCRPCGLVRKVSRPGTTGEWIDQIQAAGKNVRTFGTLSTRIRHHAPQSGIHAPTQRRQVHAGEQHEPQRICREHLPALHR